MKIYTSLSRKGDVTRWARTLDLPQGLTLTRPPSASNETRQAKVENIRSSDWIFAWIDSPHCLEQILDIGIASASNTPVFLSYPPDLGEEFKHDATLPFEFCTKTITCLDVDTAWSIFIGSMDERSLTPISASQRFYIENLLQKKKWICTLPVPDMSGEFAGKVLAYLKKGTFQEELSPFFKPVTETSAPACTLTAKEVVALVNEARPSEDHPRFSTVKHAKWVKLLQAKDNPMWTRVIPHAKYDRDTVYYSEEWVRIVTDKEVATLLLK